MMILHTYDILRSIHAVNAASKATLKNPSEMTGFHRKAIQLMDELGIDFNDLYTLKNRGIAFALQEGILQYLYHHNSKPVYAGVEDGFKFFFHTPMEMTSDPKLDFDENLHLNLIENQHNNTFTPVSLITAIKNLQSLPSGRSNTSMDDFKPNPVRYEGQGKHNIEAVNKKVIKEYKVNGFSFSQLLEENDLEPTSFYSGETKPGLYGQHRAGQIRNRKYNN